MLGGRENSVPRLQFESRGVIMVRGEDRVKFLQSLLSSDIEQVSGDRLIYSFMLTPQGRFLYDFFLLQDADSILLDCQIGYMDEIIRRFKMYKLRSAVEIENVSQKWGVYYSKNAEVGYFPDPRNPLLGVRGILQKESVIHDEVMRALMQKYHLMRMALLVPDGDLDMLYNVTLPLDVDGDLLNAINFEKGCYVGQEVTARMNWRAERRKGLYCFDLLKQSFNFSKGEVLEVEGKKLGITLGKVENRFLALLNIEDFIKATHDQKTFMSNVGELQLIAGVKRHATV